MSRSPSFYSNKLGCNRPDDDDMQIMNKFAHNINKKIKENKLDSIELPEEKSPKPFEANLGSKVSKIFDKELCNKCKVCENELN
ncbi:MAG: hypothetical protein ACRC68_15605 [Clostridium sp.]